MFLKPFRVKSNSQLKNSDRKSLRNKIVQKFPVLSETDVDKCFTNKDSVSISKIITYANNVCIIYNVNKRPMLFQYEDILYPTVYFLWIFPNVIKYFTTHMQVISKLVSGADLMIPGLVLPEKEGPAKFGRFEKGTLVAINVTTNKSAFAIGTTAHSSMDLYMAAGRGKCVTILHTLCDRLCQMDTSSSPCIPELGPPDWLIMPNVQNPMQNNEQPEDKFLNSDQLNEMEHENGNVEGTNMEEVKQMSPVDSIEEMDKLLLYCFLKALKYSGKKITLPCLTSNFYRTHIINACPVNKALDIKKTSYKKLNKFLHEMKNAGIINVAEQIKGVESITAINFENIMITSFKKDSCDVTNEQTEFISNQIASLDIDEHYTITAAVLPIFADAGLRKGDAVKSTDIRKCVTDYVKKKKLNSLENRNVIIPNKDLTDIIKTSEELTWEELMQKIFSLMSSAFKINYAGTQLSAGKGKIEPIILSISSRSGNKKVTLVDNLELFGIRAADFGKECQHGVAASTSVSKQIGKKYDQLLIQGNQIAFVGKILIEKYNIPKRFIRGLELAPKQRK